MGLLTSTHHAAFIVVLMPIKFSTYCAFDREAIGWMNFLRRGSQASALGSGRRPWIFPSPLPTQPVRRACLRVMPSFVAHALLLRLVCSRAREGLVVLPSRASADKGYRLRF
jgi:hypothetical protein